VKYEEWNRCICISLTLFLNFYEENEKNSIVHALMMKATNDITFIWNSVPMYMGKEPDGIVLSYRWFKL
jgi:hypothetical protein